MKTTQLAVPGISCGGCANAIRRALDGQPGVSDVSVDVAGKTVTVQLDEANATRETVVNALDRIGFPVTGAESGDESASR